MAGFSSADAALLTLNNNRSAQMHVNVTAVTLEGEEIALQAAELVSRESRLARLSDLLTAARVSGRVGFIRLQYSGHLMELGAQLTLYPQIGGSGLDSPRSLSVDFRSTQRASAFVVPKNGEATIALSNAGSKPVAGLLTCALPVPFFLLPRVTQLFKVSTDADSDSNEGHSCEVTYAGKASDVRAFGYVSVGDYAAPIRFYDPATATSTDLTSVALQTKYNVTAVVHNTTKAPVTVIPKLQESALAPAAAISLDPITLPPFGTKVLTVDLSNLRVQNKQYANLRITTNAASGSIVGASSQTDENGIVEDIPLRTSNPPRYDRGAYPLRWTEDYTNRVSITNTAEEPRGFRATITAGPTVYVLKKQMLEPGSTMIFDVDQLRQSGASDLNGVPFPRDAPYGKFLWQELSDGKTTGLIGRTSLASIHNRRRSSFSCGDDCQREEQYPFLYDFTGNFVEGTTQYVSVYELYTTYSQPQYGYPITTTLPIGGSWFLNASPYTTPQSNLFLFGQDNSQYPYLSFTPIGLTSSGQLSWTVTDIYTYLPNYEYNYCLTDTSYYTQSLPFTIKPKIVVDPDSSTHSPDIWYFGAGLTQTGYKISLPLSTTGGSSATWSVTQGSSAVSLSSTTGTSITVSSSGSSFSSSAGDIRITATVGGVTSDPVHLTTHVPNKLVPGTIDLACNATFGYESHVNYTIQDQLGVNIPAGVDLNEQWTGGVSSDYAGTNWRRGNEGTTHTSSSSFFDDIQGENFALPPTPIPTCAGTSGTTVEHWGQDWRVGSLTVGQGARVQSDNIQKYIDHAIHTAIVSPNP
jgi:hypothetical protein